jgi:hypothetical protein
MTEIRRLRCNSVRAMTGELIAVLADCPSNQMLKLLF